MNPFLDLLYLTLVVVFIVDLSGWTDTWLGYFSRWLGYTVKEFKPFTCSLCSSWWAGIIYLIVTGQFSLGLLAYVALLAYLSFPIREFFIFLNDLLLKWINKLT